MLTPRRALALAILLCWGGVVGMHVRREYFKPDLVRLREGARSLAPGAHFYAIRMGGSVIGVAVSRLDTIPGGFQFDDLATLDIPAQDTVQRALVRTRARLDAALQLTSFHFSLESGIGRFEVVGEARADSLLDVRLVAGGAPERSVIPFGRDVILPVALPLRLAAGGELQVGRSLRVQVFDPATLSLRVVAVSVVGRDTLIVPDSVDLAAAGEWVVVTTDTVSVWRVEERMGGVTLTSWIDGEGRLVRSESPLGFTIERTAYELAQAEWQAARSDRRLAAGYGAIIESTAIASRANLRGVDRAEALTFRLRGVALGGFDMDGGRQSLSGDTLTVRRESPAALRAAYELPYRGGGEPASELAATPLVQAADPAIIRTAQQIAGGARDPVEIARRLNSWVYRELRKEITPSVPSAIQVLEARRGDCNEHTVLYVALARALGLPARTAVGVVHLRGRFYYHAWPEVWLDGWVAVDPTLGQFPADAAHIRFLVGGLARQFELVRLIGRLEIEVL
jgi:hypothetical protein